MHPGGRASNGSAGFLLHPRPENQQFSQHSPLLLWPLADFLIIPQPLQACCVSRAISRTKLRVLSFLSTCKLRNDSLKPAAQRRNNDLHTLGIYSRNVNRYHKNATPCLMQHLMQVPSYTWWDGGKVKTCPDGSNARLACECLISWQLNRAAQPRPAPLSKPSSSSRAAAARQWDASLVGGRVVKNCMHVSEETSHRQDAGVDCRLQTARWNKVREPGSSTVHGNNVQSDE